MKRLRFLYRFVTQTVFMRPRYLKLLKLTVIFMSSYSTSHPPFLSLLGLKKLGNCVLKSGMKLENFKRFLNIRLKWLKKIAQQLKMTFIKWGLRKKKTSTLHHCCGTLLLRYTSMQSHKLLQEEFNMPSVSLLEKKLMDLWTLWKLLNCCCKVNLYHKMWY